MPSADLNSETSPDLLYYYKKLFPFDLYFKWLAYDSEPEKYFGKREFSFTLENDIYLRYQSFKDQEDMENEIKKKCPNKIDLGAVYSFRPKDRRTVSIFIPQEKELVFDIDMTDYDDVRYCCSGAEICSRCWKFMKVAVKILDASLRDDFGFNHILWVYSGRRGIHCWVCDKSARALSSPERSAVAEYLQVIKGGDNQSKKVYIPSGFMHPHLQRSIDIADEYFEEMCFEDQEMLSTQERWDKVLALIPDNTEKEALSKIMPKCLNSSQRWQTIMSELSKVDSKKTNSNLVSEMKLQLVYPRLDINVSKQLNHLLKSPFCIHPKTGRVCVPFAASDVDNFDPMLVPTLSQLIEEVSNADSENTPEKTLPESSKTSLKKSVKIFEKFLTGLGKETQTDELY